jgi:site-specific recombinase XerD
MNLIITERGRLRQVNTAVSHGQTLPSATMGEMVCRYLQWKDVGVSSEHTKRAYHYEINRLLRFIGENVPADALDRVSVRAFALQLDQQGLKPQTRKRALAYVRDLIRWAHSVGIYPDNFALTLKLPRIPKIMPQTPSEIQMHAILDGAPTTAWPLRDRCIAEILYCNLRVCEVAAIDLGDIVGGDLLVHGKGKRERKAFLTASAKVAVDLYLPTRESFLRRREVESNALFVNQRDCRRITGKSIHRIIKAMAHGAGLPKYVSPVKLRAACATHLLNHGAPFTAVSQLLGHETIATTMHYVGAVSPKRMRESYDNAFKR